MPADDANVVHNTVVSNCIPTALLVARDIRLPPPFPFPHINMQKKARTEPRRTTLGSGVRSESFCIVRARILRPV